MSNNLRDWVEFWLTRISHDMEIRLISPTGVVTQHFGRDIDRLVKTISEAIGKQHIYFGILGRISKAGAAENVKEAHCVWADIDFKDLQDGKVEADGMLATFDYRPSMLISTGGGYHAYWFLSEKTEDLARVGRIVKGLAFRLKGDPKVVDVSRVFRTPWTLNVKQEWKASLNEKKEPGPAREVQVVSLLSEQEYTLDDFSEWEVTEVIREEKPDASGLKVNIKEYLKYYKVPVVKMVKAGASTLYCLKQCLFEEGHTTAQGQDNQSAIGQQEDGKLFYQCFHVHCSEKKWEDVKRSISGSDSLAAFVSRDLRTLIEKYVERATGQFSIGAMTGWLDIKTTQERAIAMMVLEDLENNRSITRCGNKHGVYRPVEHSPRTMNLGGIKREPSKIQLPFDLHTIVRLYPKNVILVAGEKDLGKSAFALNVAYLNRDVMPVRYINSEMGEEELEARLLLFPDKRLAEWGKILWIEQSSKFEDVIDPNGLNIIDFLEIGKDAYEVVDDIKRVFDRLRDGLLLIVMQKRSYKEFGVGGEGTLEKARLAVNLERRQGASICKITVAKNWTGKIKNPRGYECEYMIWSGGRMEMTKTGWYDPDLEMAAGFAKKETRRLRVAAPSKAPDTDFPHEED